MSLRRLLNPTDDDAGDEWPDDMRRVRPRLGGPVDWALNPTEDHPDQMVYPTDMSFNHSFADQDMMFVNQLVPIPGLDAISFDQTSFLQPVPDDVGLSGTSMTSTPGLEFIDGPVGNVDVSMVDVASSVQEEQVCYGMLVHEKVKLVGISQDLETKILALKETNQHFQTLTIQPSSDGPLFLRFPDGTDLGYLSKKMEQALQGLIGRPLFEIDALTNLNSLIDSLRRAGKPSDAAARVSINVYGRESDRDKVGRELSNKDLFLQHPDGCRVGVKYDNPHILHLDGMDETDTDEEDEEDVIEVDVAETTPEQEEGLRETLDEVFNSLTRGDHLRQLGGSETLNRTLYQSVTNYLAPSALGWKLICDIPDEYRLWQPKPMARGQLYFHVITGNEQHEQPDESGGGILADEMGMGKSLTTLVLMAKTLQEARQWVEHAKALPGASLAETPTRATLVIVPSRVLINTWEREIDDHLNAGIKMMRYHGRSRKDLISNIDRYDIVITTYNTLAKEHDAKILGKGQSPLHDFAWYRVVLDEAHMIRRRSTTFHRAVVELRAKSRWCLSGTPIQNSLGDLGSLLAFIQLKPFHDPRNFSHWIANPFGVRATKRKAIERLTHLLEAVCLRRTIERVDLPGQRSEIRLVQFTPEERAKYELTRKDMKRFIHQQAGEYNQQAETFGMFQVFLQLRSFCNHGTYQPRFSWAKRNLLEDELDPVCSMTRDSLNRCSGCRQPLPVIPHDRRPKYVESCKHVLCDDCSWGSSTHPDPEERRHCPLCESLRGARYRGHIPGASNQRNRDDADFLNADGYSSKMRALISDVQRDIRTTKSIIFSCWTRTLDLIAKHLKASRIEFERIDGKTSTSQRQKILDRFDGTRTVPVLIMTTGTGAFGLNLQSVNRVFIVEPQWNPSVESQAIARAIRLGQEQQVLVTRYRVENSIEEAMCSQQTHKLKISQMDFKKDLEASPTGDEGASDQPSDIQ
ncbi:helicase-like transcription factor HLTF/DNA helicase RAD5, DEAD-box [Aspergillus oryzae 100-8]|uniref:Helicase-like transcription factor HLTF/DNA helicase RAD5, DEAD-box superfamily n=1 Tax=Aspergillus oryzae (strain 3.042) TaxID=1160506 RepID=I8TII1_ASPO3|nr:helicase-like transcription factor HLTF/DNA helicase RAD5, DEAD-box superfamily [Aspergillus oryzae 3.042]KDE86056.1 helicase-like transcription factor HLTF/DNA helicase RAD5, DEAD-box [Aspergillus oryzae 100-8]|eukprot:EIT73865.1 helicase-like transcription factor HLTF/DNA helicase RAD5, DEAD-box superfamily [Aspergillus oryzae 3.042]